MNRRTFMCFPFFKDKALTLSYDDGTICDRQLVDIFITHGLKGTFNLASSWLDNGGYLTKEQAKEIFLTSNMEVAVHGAKHLSLTNVDIASATNDVLSDRVEHEKTFGRIVKGMAYANGAYDDRVVGILKTCGIKYSRTVDQTGCFDFPEDWLRWHPTCHHDNPKLMELAKDFIEYKRPVYFWAHRPKLFYVWGHSYEFRNKNNWEVIEKFAEYISGNDDIWYATNGEIYDYVKAYDSLEWSVDCSVVHNPTSIDVFVNYFGKQITVKAGQTISFKNKGEK